MFDPDDPNENLSHLGEDNSHLFADDAGAVYRALDIAERARTKRVNAREDIVLRRHHDILTTQMHAQLKKQSHEMSAERDRLVDIKAKTPSFVDKHTWSRAQKKSLNHPLAYDKSILSDYSVKHPNALHHDYIYQLNALKLTDDVQTEIKRTYTDDLIYMKNDTIDSRTINEIDENGIKSKDEGIQSRNIDEIREILSSDSGGQIKHNSSHSVRKNSSLNLENYDNHKQTLEKETNDQRKSVQFETALIKESKSNEIKKVQYKKSLSMYENNMNNDLNGNKKILPSIQQKRSKEDIKKVFLTHPPDEIKKVLLTHPPSPSRSFSLPNLPPDMISNFKREKSDKYAMFYTGESPNKLPSINHQQSLVVLDNNDHVDDIKENTHSKPLWFQKDLLKPSTRGYIRRASYISKVLKDLYKRRQNFQILEQQENDRRGRKGGRRKVQRKKVRLDLI